MSNNEYIFLTVGNEKQKRITEKLVASVMRKTAVDIRVICDSDFDVRIGSGGALLRIIEDYYESGEKILLINSGGISKRAVNYSVKGKAFANVCCENEIITLLEFIIRNCKRLMSKFSSGILVCCSDILVDTREINVSFDDNVGFCIKTDVETGSRHGVMFCDENCKLTHYLHKCSIDELQNMNCKNDNEFLVDTGMIYFNDDFTSSLHRLSKREKIVDRLCKNGIELNLYPEIVSLLSENIDANKYLFANSPDEKLIEVRKIFFDALSKYSLDVCVIKKQGFLHFGTINESIDNVFKLSGQKDFISFNSFIDDNTQIGEMTVLENVMLKNSTVGKNCLLSDISLDGVTISDNTAVCGFKLTDGSYVTVVCSTKENPKDVENGIELWSKKRFCKSKNFNDSFEKFINGSDNPDCSLEDCTENADEEYFTNQIEYLNSMNSYTVRKDYLQIREQIIKNHFSKIVSVEEIKCLCDKVSIELPVRVNLSGTWTDAMPYCIENGGQVINMAVTVNGQKPITVTVERINGNAIEFCSDNVSTVYDFDMDEDMLSDFCLHKAALEAIGINSQTDIKDGFRLTTKVSGIDKGSGLGTSSILLGGCFKALNKMFGLGYSEGEILKMVFVAEQIMKTGGGWQDQVGGLFPGVKAGTTEAGIEQELDVKYIRLTPAFKKMLDDRLIIIPTGQRHFGRFIVNDVANRYLEKNEESIIGHNGIRQLNDKLVASIEAEDFQTFFYCINRHFELLKKISPLVSNDDIEHLVVKCREYTDAISILGAGGGGYLLAILKENASICDLQKMIRVKFPTIKSDIKKIDILLKI